MITIYNLSANNTKHYYFYYMFKSKKSRYDFSSLFVRNDPYLSISTNYYLNFSIRKPFKHYFDNPNQIVWCK